MSLGLNLGLGLGSGGGGGTPTPTPAPSWSVNPSISGTMLIGSTLTGADGTISNGTVSARQWRRDGVDISGATSSTYVLTSADIGPAITYRVTATGAGGSASATSASVTYTPAALFAASEPGGWYDPSDLSTMFQDTAGTTPVTAAGQLVARINDKSGRGNHLLQATSASRPLYQVDVNGRGHLLFDGTDDGLATSGNVNLSAIDKVTLVGGFTKLADAVGRSMFNAAATSTSSGFFEAAAATSLGDGGRRTWFMAQEATGVEVSASAFIYAAPDTRVYTGCWDKAATTRETEQIMRLNQVAQTLTFSGTSLATGNFANAQWFMGRRAGSGLPFNGRIYGLVVRGAATSGASLTTVETWVNSKTGAF